MPIRLVDARVTARSSPRTSSSSPGPLSSAEQLPSRAARIDNPIPGWGTVGSIGTTADRMVVWAKGTEKWGNRSRGSAGRLSEEPAASDDERGRSNHVEGAQDSAPTDLDCLALPSYPHEEGARGRGRLRHRHPGTRSAPPG